MSLDEVYIRDKYRKLWQTPEGGMAIRTRNDTGALSVKGTIVKASTSLDDAVEVTGANEAQAMGVMYENGVPDGEYCWVVVSGIADVLLQDDTIATRGYWARTSVTTGGRANITNPAPPGGGVPELDIHMAEIGHGLESKGSGTDVLAKAMIHFN